MNTLKQKQKKKTTNYCSGIKGPDVYCEFSKLKPPNKAAFVTVTKIN